MRVLLQVNADRDEAGGVQAMVRSLARHLAGAGHRVQASWSHASGEQSEKSEGRVDPLHVRPAGRKGRRAVHLPSLLRAARLLASFRPDIVNVHYASANALYFLLLRNLFGYRLVVTLHGSDLLDPLEHDRVRLPRLLAGADAVAGVSPVLVERVDGEIAGRDTRFLPNGVDTAFWSPAERIGGKRANACPRLVAIGRLERVKGFDLLVEAFAKLLEHHPGARLRILGEGSMRGELESRIDALGLGSRVELPGVQPREVVRDLLQRSDLFVLPSRSEGMPLALLEAMACGVPCVACDVGGVARTGGEAVRLVPREDPDALARSLIEIAEDGPLRRALSEAAVARAGEHSAVAALAAHERFLLDAHRRARPRPPAG